MDRLNTKCGVCSGKYIETSINDDREGVLHCNQCGNEVKRHSEDDWVCCGECGAEQAKAPICCDCGAELDP